MTEHAMLRRAVSRVVQKFGGSSVADADSIKRVAKRVLATKQAGNDVVVVISAMGDTTDELLDLAYQVSPMPAVRELDMLLTTGERQSAALLAMALSDLGVTARSYTGSQAGVITTGKHGDARIIDITPGRIESSLGEGSIVIVAGFQGVAQDTKDITTLGRGASDTTAVALAAALQADYCEIYTDVDGIFTADPRICPKARHIPEISYEEMMELAASGAKVLHLRCVEYARREDVRIQVRSSFTDNPGTWVKDLADITPITDKEGNPMEQPLISGVSHTLSEAQITIVGVPDKVGEAATIFDAIAARGVNIDTIVQNVSRISNNRTDVSFTLDSSNATAAMEALTEIKEKVGFEELHYDDQIGKVSVVGVGMKSHPGVTARFFRALADAGVNLGMISTSEIRISVIVDGVDVQKAVQAAHAAFGLDAEGEAVVYAGTGR
jgi:aspartate kinase